MTRLLAIAFACAGLAASLAAQGTTARKEAVDGIRNFTNVEPTVACAGATEVRAIPELRTRGYRAIINLRQASEPGADIDGTRAAAEAAGIHFIHLPFNSRQPDPAVADAFLKAIADPANQPTFVNCASAVRVSASHSSSSRAERRSSLPSGAARHASRTVSKASSS